MCCSQKPGPPWVSGAKHYTKRSYTDLTPDLTNMMVEIYARHIFPPSFFIKSGVKSV